MSHNPDEKPTDSAAIFRKERQKRAKKTGGPFRPARSGYEAEVIAGRHRSQPLACPSWGGRALMPEAALQARK